LALEQLITSPAGTVEPSLHIALQFSFPWRQLLVPLEVSSPLESAICLAWGVKPVGLGSLCIPINYPLPDPRLEGIATFLVASISPSLIKDWPPTKFLTDTERDRVLFRLAKDVINLEPEFNKKFIWEAFKNFKLYIMVFIYLGANCGGYAIAFFLPTIINDLGYSAATYEPPHVLSQN
jgi:hypothetical protein